MVNEKTNIGDTYSSLIAYINVLGVYAGDGNSLGKSDVGIVSSGKVANIRGELKNEYKYA